MEHRKQKDGDESSNQIVVFAPSPLSREQAEMSGPAAVPLVAKTERCGFSSSRKRRRDAGGNEFPLRPPGMPPMMPLVGDPQTRAWHGEEQSAPISWQPFAGAAAGDVSTAGSGPGGCVLVRAFYFSTSRNRESSS